jgi:hypothetical protein
MNKFLSGFISLFLFLSPINAGISCNGSNQGATVPSSPSLTISGPVTLMCWVYPLTNPFNYSGLIVNAASGNRQYSMFLSATGTSDIFVGMGNTAGPGDIPLSIPWVNNAWNHITVTADGANILVYINGVLSGSSPSALDGGGGAVTTSLGYDSGSNDYHLKGYMDDVRVYSRALSAKEILNIASSRERYLNTNSLAAYWPMDDGIQGAIVNNILDRSGNGNTGTAANSPTWQLSNWINYP